MKRKIVYDPERDELTVAIDKLPDDSMHLTTSEPVEGIVFLSFDQRSGGLLEITISDASEISTNLNYVIGKGNLKYDPDCDTLLLKFLPEQDQRGLCDMVHADAQLQFLITLNRNKVGNLVGAEFVGFDKLLKFVKKKKK
jgi:uncharacterized protein YuzE